MEILGRAEVQGQHFAAGIVERPMEGHGGPAPGEPVRGTPVEEHQATGPGLGEPAATMAAAAAGGAWRGARARPGFAGPTPGTA